MQPRFKTTVVEETVADLRFQLEVVADFDEVLEHYAQLSDEEADNTPYYAHLWPAARALVTWMAERPDMWQGRSVLELGCGLGLPAMTAAKLGARVFACDFHPDNGAFLVRNAARNGAKVDVFTMDWNRPALGRRFDLVLGSDLVYEPAMIEPLLRAVSQLLKPEGTFILADPGRPHFGTAVERAEALGFTADLSAEDDGFVVALAHTRD
jgi:predicted nicotinamide N-methyase